MSTKQGREHEMTKSYEDALKDFIDEYEYEFMSDETGHVDDSVSATRAWKMAARIIADIYGKTPKEVQQDALIQHSIH